MEALRWLAIAAGVGLLLVTFIGVFNALVLPRSARAFFGTHVGVALRFVLRMIANRMRTYEQRDTVLA